LSVNSLRFGFYLYFWGFGFNSWFLCGSNNLLFCWWLFSLGWFFDKWG